MAAKSRLVRCWQVYMGRYTSTKQPEHGKLTHSVSVDTQCWHLHALRSSMAELQCKQVLLLKELHGDVLLLTHPTQLGHCARLSNSTSPKHSDFDMLCCCVLYSGAMLKRPHFRQRVI